MSRFTERIENFNKAFNIYQEAVKAYDPNKVLTHMALVQTYEICFELAWKCLKDYLKEKGIEANVFFCPFWSEVKLCKLGILAQQY